MGLFGGSSTYVSSTVYNMAGDLVDHPKYMDSVVAHSVLVPNGKTLSENINSAYLQGPGIKLRSFARWAESNYSTGIPSPYKSTSYTVNISQLIPFLPVPTGQTARVESVQYDTANYSRWGEQWLLENFPERITEGWTTNGEHEPGTLTIRFFSSTDTYTFPLVGYEDGVEYAYVNYVLEPSKVPKLFIYKMGAGTVQPLERSVDINDFGFDDFYPVIPVRLDNKFVSEAFQPGLYGKAKKAYKKATGQSFDELVEKVADNASLDEIDYCHVVFGVCANTIETSGRKYMFRFLDSLIREQATDVTYYQTWKRDQADYEIGVGEYIDWENERALNELAAGPPPDTYVAPQLPKNRIRYKPKAGGIALKYDVEMLWNYVQKTTGSGLAKVGAKAGQSWWQAGSSFAYNTTVGLGSSIRTQVTDNHDTHTLFWQVSPDRWEAMSVNGMVYRNHVYGNKYTEVTLTEGLADPDDSEFVFPLHSPSIARMSLVDSTQLSSSAVLLVFSSYKVVKKKWYQTGIFKILLIVVIITTIALTGGFSAAGIGILGTNLAVGTALGFAGLAAVIAGVVVNAVAAMIITSIITKGATAIFGEQIGAIIGMVVSILAVNGLTNMAGSGSFAINFGQMSTAEAIIRATSAVGNATSMYAAAEAQKTFLETQELLEDYDEESERISKLYAENIGSGNSVFDPLALTDTDLVAMESPGTFLNRTLMTGSDIAELSLGLVSNFTEISLSTELPNG